MNSDSFPGQSAKDFINNALAEYFRDQSALIRQQLHDAVAVDMLLDGRSNQEINAHLGLSDA